MEEEETSGKEEEEEKKVWCVEKSVREGRRNYSNYKWDARCATHTPTHAHVRTKQSYWVPKC